MVKHLLRRDLDLEKRKNEKPKTVQTPRVFAETDPWSGVKKTQVERLIFDFISLNF